MKVLITGGCGFLGTNLAVSILGKEEVFVIDNLRRYGSSMNLEWLRENGKLTFFQEDTRNAEKMEKIIREVSPEVIFHLAGQVAMTTSLENPREDFEINTLGTINILEAVRKHAPQCIVIYSSTNKVYGDLEEFTCTETEKRFVAEAAPHGFDEQVQLSFHSPYGCSKGAADQYVLDYARMYGLKTVVFRHSSMYGGRQFSTADQGWIGWFCLQAVLTEKGLLKEPFTISGNGKQVRDVLHGDDMIALYMTAIKNIDVIKGQAFNIGGGMHNSLSLLELIDMLESELGVKLKYRQIAWRQSDQKVFVADVRKFSGITGWKPEVDKLQGVRRMLEWIKTMNFATQKI